MAKKYHLPLFLHSRAAHADFVRILREEGFGDDGGSAVGGKGGVVHSFTGRKAEMEELVNSRELNVKSYLTCFIGRDGLPCVSQRVLFENRREP